MFNWQSSHSTAQCVIYVRAFYYDPWASPSWFLLSHSCVCGYNYYSFGVYSPLCRVCYFLQSITLLQCIQTQRVYICRILFVDSGLFWTFSRGCFLHRGVFHFNHVSSTLYHLYILCCFFDNFSFIFDSHTCIRVISHTMLVTLSHFQTYQAVSEPRVCSLIYKWRQTPPQWLF